MISVEAEKYWGGFWLLVREWDGIDQPQRMRIFKITEEEIDFKGGRFERIRYAKKPFKQKLTIGTTDEINIEEIINWIDQNTTGFWYFDISMSINDCFYDGMYCEEVWIFDFKEDKDAMAFKLRWL